MLVYSLQLLSVLMAVRLGQGDDIRSTFMWNKVYDQYVKDGIVPQSDAYLPSRNAISLPSAGASRSRSLRQEYIHKQIYQLWDKPPEVKGRVVAAVSTTPYRIEGMQPAVDSVLMQTYRPDLFYVFVPHRFLRDNTSYEIPEWLQQYHSAGKIKLIRCDDMGPGTAVHAVLEFETDPETSIFQVDDDQFYGPNTLLFLLLGATVLPGRAITMDTSQIYKHTHGVILQGVHGLLLQRKFFDDSVFDYSVAGNFSRYCWLHNDLWWSLHLARKGIRRESLEMRQGSRVLPGAYSKHALYQGGSGTDNYQNFYLCNAAVLKNYPDVWQPRPRLVLVVGLTGTEDFYTLLGGLQMQSLYPHKVYLCGAVAWSDFRIGGWLRGFLVVSIPDCDGTSVLGDLLSQGLRWEDDPETVVVSGNPLVFATSKSLLEDVTACVVSEPPDAYPHHLPRCSSFSNEKPQLLGIMGCWRGSYNNIIMEGVSMPIFDTKGRPHQPPPSGWSRAPTTSFQSRLALQDYTDFPLIVAVIRVRPGNSEFVHMAVQSILYAELKPVRMYVALDNETTLHIDLKNQRSGVRMIDVEQDPLGHVYTVARLEGPRVAILVLEAQLYREGFLQAMVETALQHPGASVGVDGIIYRGIGPIFTGAALYPPGSINSEQIGLIPEISDACCGADELWLGASLAANGVPAIVLDQFVTSRLVKALPVQSWLPEVPNITMDEVAWDKCFSPLWSKLGTRLQQTQLRTSLFIVLSTARLPAEVLSGLDPLPLEEQLLSYNLDILHAQTLSPSRAYIMCSSEVHHDESNGVLSCTAFNPLKTMWIGDASGFEVQPLSCGACNLTEMLTAASEVELNPKAFMIFASAERLLNDQLVAENVQCLEKIIRHRKVLGACGYPLWSDSAREHNHRIVEFAALREHVLALATNVMALPAPRYLD